MTDLRYHVIVIGGGMVVFGSRSKITRRIPLPAAACSRERRPRRPSPERPQQRSHPLGIYYKLGSLKAGLCFTAAAQGLICRP
jgi:hypothetical protein